MRVIVVEDERPARVRLRRLLAAHADVEIVGEAPTAADARALLTRERPDVMFLDVQMPGESGFDLLATLPGDAPRPHVIFTTAFEAYAVRAFEAEALDYLMKPFRPDRLAAALSRARTELSRRGTPAGEAVLAERLDRLLARLEAGSTPREGDAARREGDAAARGAPVDGTLRESGLAARGLHYLDRLTARVGERVDVIPVREILYFRAEDKYVAAYTATGSHLLTLTLDQLEAELDPVRFARVHRSVLVYLEEVASVEPAFAGTYTLQLRSLPSVNLPVSRQRARALRQRLRF